MHYNNHSQDGPAPKQNEQDESTNESNDADREENQIICVIYHKNKKHKFYLSTADGKIEDNEYAFQDFCDFLEQTFGMDNIDIGQWPANLQLYSIEDEQDVKNDENEIQNSDDFGDLFDNCDLQSGDPSDYTRYFVFKITGDTIQDEVEFTIALKH